MPRSGQYELQPGKVWARLIQSRAAVAASNAMLAGKAQIPTPQQSPTTVLGQVFAAQEKRGVNGKRGFASGSYERRLQEEGTFQISFPNGAGEDGVMHRDRFMVLTFDNYRPGDEWFEIYRGEPGDLLFVGTPTGATITEDTITIRGVDALWLLKKVRTTAAEWWNHAPRDVFEHYTGVWTNVLADDFSTTGPVRFTWNTTEQTTADGKWRYTRVDQDPNNPSTLRTRPNAVSTGAQIRAGSAPAFLNCGTTGSDQHWRIETSVRTDAMTGTSEVLIALQDTLGNWLCYLELIGQGDNRIFCYSNVLNGATSPTMQAMNKKNEPPGTIKLAIEGRGRWLYFYLQNELIYVQPMMAGSVTGVPYFRHYIGPTGSTSQVAYIENFIVRKWQPFLMRGSNKGDYHLPGAPVAAGLVGEYHNDADLNYNTWNDEVLRSMAPTREPYARRVDAAVNFAGANPPTFQPVGASGAWPIAARWFGSVYLDLDNYDYRFRTVASDRIRLGVGKTRVGVDALVVDDWFVTADTNVDRTNTSNWVKGGASSAGAGAGSGSYLSGLPSGWYPIMLEWHSGGGYGGVSLQAQRSDDTAAFTVCNVPRSSDAVLINPLSPMGTFQAKDRYESNYDQLKKIGDTIGLQYTLQPRQLESGMFPGELLPKVRQGRDTDQVLDADESVSMGTEISADDLVDTLLIDAAGIADPKGTGQLTVEGVNFGTIEGQGHLFPQTEYESLSEVTFPALVQQRANSLIGLRNNPWEQVTAQPQGKRRLADTFPVSNQMANMKEFSWDPGDGVRLRLPLLGVEDRSPRQIMGHQRNFVPDGLADLAVNFRQRPRSFGDTLRRMLKASLNSDRNYQGQFVTTAGQPAAWNGATQGGSGTVDAYSRVALPMDTSKIVSVTLCVFYKSGSSGCQIEVLGAARDMYVYAPGRFDITRWVQHNQGGTAGANIYFYVRTLNPSNEVLIYNVEVVTCQ